MQRDDTLRHWDLAWNEGLWHAKWSQALEGRTPEQAATRPMSPAGSPATSRHSIWQLANHIIFWRTSVIDRTHNGDKLSDTDVEERNWVEPADVSDESWSETKRRYEQSHIDFRALIADESISIDTFECMPYHDSYHIGQIMQLRAGFGLEPIE